MLSEPRTIALIMELIHLPMQHSGSRLRSLYTRLCAECDFENFTRKPDGAQIERPASEEAGLSRLTLTADRIRFTEERGLLTVDSYCRRLAAVLGAAMEELSIPLFIMHQCTVRSLATPGGYNNAGEFISQQLLKVPPENIAKLERPAQVFGVRLVAPPTKETPSNFQVRVEVYARDPKSIYMENVGVFRSPIKKGGLNVATQSISATSEFVSENVYNFLSSFENPG